MKKHVSFWMLLLCLVTVLCAFSACSGKGPKYDSISVKTNPTKVEFDYNEDFSSEGLVIKGTDSNGNETDLSEDLYTVDASAYDKTKSGDYEIVVKLKADETKTCKFTVTVKAAPLSKIEVDTTGATVRFEVDDFFSAFGIVVNAFYADGSSQKLKSTEYTVDSSAFDGEKTGTYAITVTLKEDPTKTCSYDVKVVEVVSVAAKPGYYNKFITGEWVFLGDLNLTIVETYSDQSTAEFSGEELEDRYSIYDGSLETSEPGTGLTATLYSWYHTKECDITYDCLAEDTLNVSELTMTVGPDASSVAYASRDEVYQLFSNIRFNAKYTEIPDRVFDLDYYGVDRDFSEIEDAETPGTYKAVFTYGGKTVECEITLIDVEDYTLDSVFFDTSKPYPTWFFVGEDEDYIYDDLLYYHSFVATYKKSGSEDLILPYYPVGMLDVDLTDLTKEAGKKALTIKEGDDTLFSYDVEVVDFTLEEGTYLETYGGYYDEFFQKTKDGFLFYNNSTDKYEDGYTLYSITRHLMDDDQLMFTFIFTKDMSMQRLEVNADRLPKNCLKLDENDFRISLFYMGMEVTSFYAIDGKLPSYIVEELYTMGDLHLDSKTGELIDPSDYVFTKDGAVYIVFQQDATGQPFLGNYVPNDDEAEGYLVVKADGVYMYSSKEAFTKEEKPESSMEYRFAVKGDTVSITITYGSVTIDLKTGLMTTPGGTYVREAD